MKALFSALLVTAVAALTMVGCGSDKKSSDPYANNPYAYGYNGFNNMYGGYAQMNPNAVILSGTLSLNDAGGWKKALRSIGACNDQLISTCSYIDNGAPKITMVLNDYNFPNNATTPGSITLGSSQVQGRPFQTQFYKVTDDKGNVGFDTQILGTFTDSSKFFAAPSQTPMRVLTNGRSTDSSVTTMFYYGNTLVATGRLVRINR